MTLGIRIECHNAECSLFLIVTLSVVRQSAVMLSVVAPTPCMRPHFLAGSQPYPKISDYG